jgi:hypothetical protein
MMGLFFTTPKVKRKPAHEIEVGTVKHDGEKPQIWFDGKPIFSLDDLEADDGRIAKFCEWVRAQL